MRVTPPGLFSSLIFEIRPFIDNDKRHPNRMPFSQILNRVTNIHSYLLDCSLEFIDGLIPEYGLTAGDFEDFDFVADRTGGRRFQE